MLCLHFVMLMYYGNLTVFNALDKVRKRVYEYQGVNGMTNFKKATWQTLKKICCFSAVLVHTRVHINLQR